MSNANSVYEKLDNSKRLLTLLKENRIFALDKQREAIYDYQSRMLDYYKQLIDTKSLNSFQEKIVKTKEKLAEGEGSLLPEAPPENPEYPNLPTSDDDKDSDDQTGEQFILESTHAKEDSNTANGANRETKNSSAEEQLAQMEELLKKLHEYLQADEQIPDESKSQFEIQLKDIQKN
ncbi:hypothetical protein AAHH67_27860 [Niallia circulans]